MQRNLLEQNNQTPPRALTPARFIFFSPHRLLGEQGVRGCAIVALAAILCGLYWYQHHAASVSPAWPNKPYHYALAKSIPLPQATRFPPPVSPSTPSLVHTLTAPTPSVIAPAFKPGAGATAQKVITLMRQPSAVPALPISKPTHPVKTAQASRYAESGYTIQLMGSFDRHQAQHRQALLHVSQTHIFNTSYKQKPWYVLGVGQYKTRAEAQAALHQLPVLIQQSGAWVRPL